MAIELRHLRHVIAVAETGQLTRAAARLHNAQPALSQSIARVEREVGSPLFHRHPQGVDLTPAGEAFVEHARRAVTAAKRQVDAILDGTVDAAVLCPGPPDPNFESIPIATPQLVVFLADSHHLATRSALRFADIDQETYLSQAPGIPDWWIDIWWLTKQRGGRPKISRRSSRTVNESIAGILTGEVIVISPDFFVPPYPIPGIATIPLVDVEAPNVEVVYQPQHATRATQLLAEVARSHRPS